MNYCFLISAMCVVGTAICAICFYASQKRSLYRFTNIMLCATAFGFAVGGVSFFFGGFADGSITASIKSFPMYFARFSVFLIAVLGVFMLVSNIELIRHEGMRPKNLVGTFLGVNFVVATVLLFIVSDLLLSLDFVKSSIVLSKIVGFATTFFFCLLDYCDCVMFGIIAVGYAAAVKKPKYDKDFIIIPGCSISKDGGLLPLLKGRTNRAVRYAWEQEIATGKKVCYIPTGGKGSDEIMSEGSAMEFYLLSHGAEPDEVFPEKQSVNTYENFEFSKRIADNLKKDAKLAFSTTNYHVLRCGLIARKLGIEAEGIASKTKWYFWPNGFAREVVAIFAMSKKHHIIASAIAIVISLLLTLR